MTGEDGTLHRFLIARFGDDETPPETLHLGGAVLWSGGEPSSALD